ncbi:hypothetical protein ACFOWU_09585 [Epilithonimonas zeae]|uniref:hypothetical protein n=1 Tax=Epilithonimonas zeae TaxID=1416779 RepID=UPI0009414564|nr:hypothetical protein [Epilithonimonas zeae]
MKSCLLIFKPFGQVSLYDPMAIPYKYNGKELQETRMYDYGARMYMGNVPKLVTDMVFNIKLLIIN